MYRCQPTIGKPWPAGGWLPPSRNPLTVESKKVRVNPITTPSVVADSWFAWFSFQISKASQPWDAVNPTAATAINPNSIAWIGSLVL